MDLTTLRGLWLHDPSLAMGHLHEIKSLGFDYLCVKIADGRKAYSPNTTRALLADAASMGLPVVFWAYVYPGEAAAAAQALADILPKGATDLILDAEVEFERCPNADQEAEALAHAIAEATAHRVALHLSSFWSPALHPRFPFAAFMKHCRTWQPQAYAEGGSRTPAQILSGALQQAKGVTACPVVPTVNATAFVPLLKREGVQGFNVWAWDPDADARVSVTKAQWELELSL